MKVIGTVFTIFMQTCRLFLRIEVALIVLFPDSIADERVQAKILQQSLHVIYSLSYSINDIAQ